MSTSRFGAGLAAVNRSQCGYFFAATAALAAAGYRASRDAYHYRVLQSLAHTVRAERDVLFKLDLFRKKRNVGGYKRAGAATDAEAEAMVELAVELLHRVRAWLRLHYPALMD